MQKAVFEAWRGVSDRDEGVVAGRNAIAAARLETARLGRLLQPLARSARRAVRQDTLPQNIYAELIPAKKNVAA